MVDTTPIVAPMAPIYKEGEAITSTYKPGLIPFLGGINLPGGFLEPLDAGFD